MVQDKMDSTWENCNNPNDVKVEDHHVKVELMDTELRTVLPSCINPIELVNLEQYLSGDHHLKDEFPTQSGKENMYESGLAVPHNYVKNELDSKGKDYNYHMDVKVEEHSIQVQLKQNIEKSSEYTLPDFPGQTTYNSVEITKSSCCQYISGLDKSNIKRHKSTHIYETTNHCRHCCRYFVKIDCHIQCMLMPTKEQLCCNCEMQMLELGIHLDHEFYESPQRIQTGEESSQYNHCKRSLSQNDSFDDYPNRQTEETPYNYSPFNKGFEQRRYLVKHKGLQTRVKPSQYGHCETYYANKSNIIQEILDKYCRVCGKMDKDMTFRPLKSIHRNIVAWMYPLLDFSFDSFVICLKCPNLFRKCYYKDYYRRKDSTFPNKRVSIVLWNNERQKPIYCRDTITYRYSVSPMQRLDGRLRKACEPFAENEVEYPSIYDNSYKTNTNEMYASSNDFENYINVEVEEQQLQVHHNTEVEQSSKQIISNNLQNSY